MVSADSPGAGKNSVRIKVDAEGKLRDICHDLGEDCQQMVFGIYKLSAQATAQYFSLANEFFKNGPIKGGFWFPLKQLLTVMPFNLVPVDDTKWVSVNTPEEYKKAVNLVGSIIK